MADYHFVRWFPADHMRDTRRMTQAEHGAYFLLLNEYYLTGEALPDDDEELCRITLSVTLSVWLSVRSALAQRFQIHDGKWFHKRCEAEIANAKRSCSARAAGAIAANKVIQERGFKRHKHNAQRNASETLSERSALHPNLNPNLNQESELTSSLRSERASKPSRNGKHPPEPEGFAEVWDTYPRHTAKAKAAEAYGKLCPDEDTRQAIIRGIIRSSKNPQWHRDGGQFIPHLATYLNGRRWEDEDTGSLLGSTLEDFAAEELAAVRRMGL